MTLLLHYNISTTGLSTVASPLRRPLNRPSTSQVLRLHPSSTAAPPQVLSPIDFSSSSPPPLINCRSTSSLVSHRLLKFLASTPQAPQPHLKSCLPSTSQVLHRLLASLLRRPLNRPFSRLRLLASLLRRPLNRPLSRLRLLASTASPLNSVPAMTSLPPHRPLHRCLSTPYLL